MPYPKLVRDKIIAIIEKEGRIPISHIASHEEYWKKLKEKLQEEVYEFLEDENEEELADILEVISTICDYKQIDMRQLQMLQKKKVLEKGSFKQKIILDTIKE